MLPAKGQSVINANFLASPIDFNRWLDKKEMDVPDQLFIDQLFEMFGFTVKKGVDTANSL